MTERKLSEEGTAKNPYTRACWNNWVPIGLDECSRWWSETFIEPGQWTALRIRWGARRACKRLRSQLAARDSDIAQLREALASRIINEWVGNGLFCRVIAEGGKLVAQNRVAVDRDEYEWRIMVEVPDRVALARELTPRRDEVQLLGEARPEENRR